MGQTPFAPWFVACGLVLAGGTPHAYADGGTLRASVRREPWQITIFTSPTPPRAGPIDVSVLVQDAATGLPIEGVRVLVRATLRGGQVHSIEQFATREAAENKLLRAADLELPESGWWEFSVKVEGDAGERAEVSFAIELGRPIPEWVSLVPWIGLPAGVLLLLAVHRLLVRRKARTHRVDTQPGD